MKLFITDIDDTLSVGETVSQEVRDACARLRAHGWEIMIATGRIFGTARGHMEAAGVTQPSILYDGARLMTPEGKEVCSSLFDLAIAEELLNFLWTFPAEIQVVGNETVRCRESDRETIRFYREAGVPVDFIASPSMKKVTKEATPSEPIYRIGLWLKFENLSAIEKKVKAAFGSRAEVISSGPKFLDILSKEVSKGSALKEFVATLPQRPEVIVAAGDHKNDLTMLSYADVAVVPSNASQEVLPLAHIVMPKAAQNGISALAEYLLSPGFSVSETRRGSPLVL
ncbi:MAG: Cof-type HAD-IIB family hydrolase [Synergistaceae bacterium]|jgi:Cof subfamily protein (haloacid dehalogenase superfamily)|nr:Cof-type HAD-IIB family hydrolase [Synergistaceae bacterium]